MPGQYEETANIEELAAFFDREDIIARIQAVEEAQKKSQYQPSKPTTSYWDRVQRAVRDIPYDYRHAAYALFSSVIYITRDLRADMIQLLAAEVAQWARERSFAVPEDVHIFTVDHDSLRDEFYRYGHQYGWEARMDRVLERRYSNVSHLVEAIERLVNTTKPSEEARQAILADQDIAAVFNKALWVLLNDNALSGGSASSDCQRLQLLGNLVAPDRRPILLVASEILTDQAATHLQRLANIPYEHQLCGLHLDSRASLASDSCTLVSPHLLPAIRSLCQWFGHQHFPAAEQLPLPGLNKTGQPTSNQRAFERFRPTLVKHRAAGGNPNFSFGWRDGGYTLIDHQNAPTNSVPLLWYPDIIETRPNKGLYAPPFPRATARLTQTTTNDSTRMERLTKTLSG